MPGSKLPGMPWGRIRSWPLVTPPFMLIFCVFEFDRLTGNVLIRGAIICVGGILVHTFCTMTYIARNAVNHATYGDAAVYAEALTGEDTKTFVYSMTSIPGTIASLLRTLVVGAALTASGYVAGADPTPAMQSGVISALVTIPLICSIAGGIIMTIYPLNQKRLAECQAKIDSGVSG